MSIDQHIGAEDFTAEERALVEQHRATRAREKAAEWQPRHISTYSSTQRSEAFGKLYTMALETFEHLRDKGCKPKDIEGYIYEEVMNLLGPGVWDAIKKQTR